MGNIIAGVAIIGVWAFLIIGWFLNLFAVFTASGNEVWIRIAGLFVAPAGSIMGWFY